MDGMSLLDVLRGVMLDPAEQAVYDADPGAYLEQYGYQDVDPADLSEAFGLVADTLPADQAMAAWTGESGPESPILGDDTVDFDVGGPDERVRASRRRRARRRRPRRRRRHAGDTAPTTATTSATRHRCRSAWAKRPTATTPTGLGADDLDADLGLFGTAAPDDTGTGDSADDGDPSTTTSATTASTTVDRSTAATATARRPRPRPGEDDLDDADDLGRDRRPRAPSTAAPTTSTSARSDRSPTTPPVPRRPPAGHRRVRPRTA